MSDFHGMKPLAASCILAAELHGDLSPGTRGRILASFVAGAVRVIVVTDIAARGIHVDGIDLVGRDSACSALCSGLLP